MLAPESLHPVVQESEIDETPHNCHEPKPVGTNALARGLDPPNSHVVVPTNNPPTCSTVPAKGANSPPQLTQDNQLVLYVSIANAVFCVLGVIFSIAMSIQDFQNIYCLPVVFIAIVLHLASASMAIDICRYEMEGFLKTTSKEWSRIVNLNIAGMAFSVFCVLLLITYVAINYYSRAFIKLTIVTMVFQTCTSIVIHILAWRLFQFKLREEEKFERLCVNCRCCC